MKKQLLQESEIRRMMKFANIGALSAGFVDRLNETSDMEEEDDEGLTEADEMPGPEMEMGAEDEEVDDMGLDDMDVDDMDVEVDEPDGEMELSQEEAQVLIDLGTRLSGEMDVEGEEEEGGEDMDAELPMPDEGEMDLGGEEDELPPMMEGRLVNEVARRVSRRIAALRG